MIVIIRMLVIICILLCFPNALVCQQIESSFPMPIDWNYIKNESLFIQDANCSVKKIPLEMDWATCQFDQQHVAPQTEKNHLDTHDKNYKPDLSLVGFVRMALQNHPDIQILETEHDSSQGRILYEQGAFDFSMGSSVTISHDEKHASFNNRSKNDLIQFQLNVDKQFRNGLRIRPSVTLNRTNDLQSQMDPMSTSSVDCLIQIPLFKDQGFAQLDEQAAIKYHEVSLYTLRHAMTQVVYDCALSYWNYLASKKDLEMLNESVNKAQQLVEETRQLIHADERPVADIEQLYANLAEKESQYIEGLQNVHEKWVLLMHTIGKQDYEPDYFPLPENPFPDQQSLKDEFEETDQFITHALTHRYDYIASKEYESYFQLAVIQAKNENSPQIDLSLRFGYSGMDKGYDWSDYVSAFGNHIPGISYLATLDMTWPYQQLSSKGSMMQKQALFDKQKIITKHIERTIRSQVKLAISSIQNSIQEIQKNSMVIQTYQIVVNNEKTKFQLGLSTILDLITTEDHLFNAKRREIASKLKFAKAISKLRFETSSLISFKNDQAIISLEQLITLPTAFKKKL